MNERPNQKSRLLLPFGVALVVVVALLYREHLERKRAVGACRAALGLAAGLAAQSGSVGDQVIRDVAAVGTAARNGEFQECEKLADAVASGLVEGAPLFADSTARKAAWDFLSEQKRLGKRFAESAKRGQLAEKEGRDASSVRRHLQAAFAAAANQDIATVEDGLAKADAALEDLPRRMAMHRVGSRLSRAAPAEAARGILLECDHPARVASELMLEGGEAVAKVRLVAEFCLAEGDARSALWLAETAAFLLGLRPRVDTGEGVAQATVAPPELPETTVDAVEGWLASGATLLEGRGAAGMTVAPADALLEEAQRCLAAGKIGAAGVLARAALNVLGMSDYSIGQMRKGARDSRGEGAAQAPGTGGE
ncbi:MAG: hypothetical protein HN742_02110 [Lentisphaerae bacterium]|nr:hypothetical protein [Lentisphaerota bacterium]MBT4819252.1 hypothetical protein [Lentisphaerota bacterium]MBT5610219.1 hypothetical protein [Lentisphaerota bacterium]MBT7060039.1 hypothetical protein [Lentisphaerota bacterium]MBT7840631.1 hypothetical protein [Lentisphaerota bacterium]